MLVFIAFSIFVSCSSHANERDLHWETGERLTIDDFLYDLDFFKAELNENFSFFGIGYRRGMDISSLFIRTRDELLAIDNIGMDDFIRVLDYELLSHTRRLGHLRMLLHEDYVGVMNNIKRNPGLGELGFSFDQQLWLDFLLHPSVVAFYGTVEVDLETTIGFEVSPNNVYTQIFSEYGFAYLTFSWFPVANMEYDRQLLLDFFYEIADMEHLIIDLRNNPGGFTQYFTELVVRPNLSNTLTAPFFLFCSGGQNSINRMNAVLDTWYLRDGIQSELLAIEELMSIHYLRYFKTEDMEWLDYGTVWHQRIDPIFDSAIFNQNIWILVNERTASAAEQVAIFAKYSGFATVVGVPTMGLTGGSGLISTFLLPNTGILIRYDVTYFTNMHGQAFDEYGLIPHHQMIHDKNIHEVITFLLELHCTYYN